MADEKQESKIIVDSDWKQEAAEEKARLEETTTDVGKEQPLPDASFPELINMLVMQAAVSLGGYKGPTGEMVQRDLATAKHFIDMLEVLKGKTKGNLTDEEDKAMEAVLYEMRMRYVEATQPPAPQPPKTG